MSNVTWYLTLYTDGRAFGNGELYERVVDMDFLPVKGDEVFIWPTDDDGTLGGPRAFVKRRYWGSDGRAEIELTGLMVDPPEDWNYATALDICRAYSTARDGGDPVAHMLKAGWKRY